MACKPMQAARRLRKDTFLQERASTERIRQGTPASQDGKSVLNRPRDGTSAVLRRETGPGPPGSTRSPSNMDASIRYVVNSAAATACHVQREQAGYSSWSTAPEQPFPGS